jgi:hypothetical protein
LGGGFENRAFVQSLKLLELFKEEKSLFVVGVVVVVVFFSFFFFFLGFLCVCVLGGESKFGWKCLYRLGS